MWEAITIFLALPLFFTIGEFYFRLAAWSALAVAKAYAASKVHSGQKGPTSSESLP